ncbi:hypothetical protein [Piscinibacter gummiphilus]|uniref:Uncharacterized protein n=1 Tax=Piscinibacter gummiphilus TaxID=946333 RepID=A0A1W6LBP8_9BURK|nr:hypothetical protein [Piscinibacter gummiphilus]ARN21701.1 hypothetical protein A4W93_18360 [Piscinibacter gummiphilus]ATU66389.1 hypothetical protein CPZ87_18450 [Piscinibacter gummiphilus]GLS95729.1 hypothetical protein GCM10007918_30210 [Piscinibacter gummiphilus]
MNFRPLSVLAISLGLLSLAACTTLEPELPVEPLAGYDLVDLAKVDTVAYQSDYKHCAAIANQDLDDVTRFASRAAGAAADRASLGIIGQQHAKDADRGTVLKRCLTGRGYNVIR